MRLTAHSLMHVIGLLLIGIFLLAGVFAWTVLPHATAAARQSSPTATPASITLPYAQWVDLFQPTEACQLPCWWGVTPGITTKEAANDLFIDYLEAHTGLDLSAYRVPPGYGVELSGYQDVYTPMIVDYNIGYIASFADETGIINRIRMNFDEWGLEAHQAVAYFAPLPLLQEYGTPDFIRLWGEHEDGRGSIFIALGLYWEDVGLAATYTHFVELETKPNGTPPFSASCFGVENLNLFTVVLVGSNYEDRIEDYPFYTSDYAYPFVEEVTGLNNAEFTTYFLDHDGCLPPSFPVH